MEESEESCMGIMPWLTARLIGITTTEEICHCESTYHSVPHQRAQKKSDL